MILGASFLVMIISPFVNATSQCIIF